MADPLRSDRFSVDTEDGPYQFLIVISDIIISLIKWIVFSKDLQIRPVLTYYINRQRFRLYSSYLSFIRINSKLWVSECLI